jgi:hypothetical protein
MTLNDQIIEIIQQISSIYINKNIPAAPINLEFIDQEIDKGTETMVLKELLFELDNLLTEYVKTEQKVHKFQRYLTHFSNLYEENSDDGVLIARAKRTA